MNWNKISIIFCIILIAVSSGCIDDKIPNTTSIPEFTLGEAIESDRVKAEITGSGASSGDSIFLELTNQMFYSIEISVPIGTLLLTSDGSQNMVVRRVRGTPEDNDLIIPIAEISLDSNETQIYIMEAYCLNFHKKNPGRNTRFSIGSSTDPQILGILDTLDTLPADTMTVSEIQTAVWVVTDDVSKDELFDRYPIDQNNIDKAKILLEKARIDTNSKALFK